ncbi:pentatricopeptide repeat-containing protein At3g22150, chloroplastic [Actinidia eriantha]|uniref:pentatricopeptide repeat-containing protein At3g22150, chloroplastic n=1 Tax=Actinidia eriantha TaxID=165200 RepID=UPI00258B9269|nr:pentatricopeptide repeat-containing protein At3g22150, chloroplastic [Actinidia eriantha]XP_057467045.1 pentatricopeptide repeat-containing protein At3g22150, chloroplastic [Actinidia eriantha]XP_057467046.1 pentatricopeptide repeat-containing protein At3g22150, chloroplastic [Actinidia eriantha]XP_057467047.1 pentatricopeptide repeat-containing protein At3g22150, chloroplastic [Actinidia eriantha]
MRPTMSSSALPLPLSTASLTHIHGHAYHLSHSSSSNNTNLHSPNLSFPPNPTQWSSEDHSNPHQPRTIRYRLSQLCRDGQPHLARQLFDEIPHPKTVLWNTIIIGFVCNGMSDEALMFYSRMKSNYNTQCDFYTYSAVLKACAETRNFKTGKAVHCHVLRSHSNPSRIVCNSLLNMYATCLSSVDEEMAFVGLDFLGRDLVCRVFDTMRKRDVIAWNTLISWYVKTERFVEAVRSFWMMMKVGIKLSVVSFVNVFPAVSRMGSVKRANTLYGLLLKLGSEVFNDPFALSSAIFMYAELGCLDFARKVFDCSLEKNPEVWNTMIGGYVQNNHPVEALNLFIRALESENTVFNDVTFLSALTAASQLQRLDFAQQLHGYLIKNSLGSRIIIINAMIVMYSRCNLVDLSFEIFSRMCERDAVSWNTMVSAFVQNGLDDEGLMLVYEMQKQGFMIDSVTVTALLSAASNIRNKEIGKQTHAYILRRGIQFEGMESYLIDMYAKSGLIEAAQGLFEMYCTYCRDQATWNAIIAGNTQNGLIEQAFNIFRRMLEQNVTPNEVTLASILPACHPEGSMALAKQLHAFAMRNCLDQNVFVGSALVDMYSKLGAITCAENAFAMSHEKNSVTYTNMILGYGQHGNAEKALSLFHSMRELGVKPDAITFVALLAACNYAGLVDAGLQIFESMEREYGIRPSHEHYCCIADMLGRVGRVVEAYEFVKELGEEGNILRIWGSLLAACRIHGEFELGKIVASKLLQMEREKSTTGYHVLLSNIYAEEGNWVYVNRVRKEMREKGLTKDVGCSWIDVAGYVNFFASRDQKHPQSDDIYETLAELAVKMKADGYRPCLDSETGWISESEE